MRVAAATSGLERLKWCELLRRGRRSLAKDRAKRRSPRSLSKAAVKTAKKVGNRRKRVRAQAGELTLKSGVRPKKQQRLGFIPRRAHPDVALLLGRQQHKRDGDPETGVFGHERAGSAAPSGVGGRDRTAPGHGHQGTTRVARLLESLPGTPGSRSLGGGALSGQPPGLGRARRTARPQRR